MLEFFGMNEKAEYSESDLETAIISKLQTFLLELGKVSYLKHGKNGSVLMRSRSLWTWFFTIGCCSVMLLLI